MKWKVIKLLVSESISVSKIDTNFQIILYFLTVVFYFFLCLAIPLCNMQEDAQQLVVEFMW